MAIKYQVTNKGSQLEYWAIMNRSWDKSTNKTSVNLVPFESKDARNASLGNAYWDLVNPFSDKVKYTFDGDIEIGDIEVTNEDGTTTTIKGCYSLIKEPKYETKVVTPAIPGRPAVDEVIVNGVVEREASPAVEEVPAVTEEVQVNPFYGTEVV